MKTIILISLLSLSVISSANPTDTISNFTVENLRIPKVRNEEYYHGVTMFITGLVLTSVGVYKEVQRKPYPTHSQAINHNPDAPRTLNYLMIGSGLSTLTGGLTLIIKF